MYFFNPLLTSIEVEFPKRLILNECLRHNDYLYAKLQPDPSSELDYGLCCAVMDQ